MSNCEESNENLLFEKAEEVATLIYSNLSSDSHRVISTILMSMQEK
jgi:hypothetical protein